MTTLRLTAALVAAALSLAPAAFAQDPPPAPQAAPPPQPAIVPPRPLSPLRAYYPEGGTGEHDVTVEITVTKEGRVKDARVVEGEPPYGDAAVKAADGWLFDPATRAGQPIVARIRVRIHFTPPAPEPPPVQEPPPPGEPAPSDKPAPKPAPPEPEVIEVVALGERPAVGTVSLGRAEVRLLPGAFGDPFRAIEALPGVTPIVSGLPYFYVRGAPPGNVGYFIDNVRVPVLYHLGLGPSVVHPGLVERVDLYPGGYPAQYGRYTGGIVAGETRPAANEWRGEASLRLIDVGAMVEAPIGDRGAALVGGRYSYTAALLSLAAPGTQLDYWDYQGRFSWDLSPRQRITVFAFGSYDYLGQEDEDTGEMQTLFSTQFHRIDLRYDAEISDKTRLRQAVTLGLDQSGFAGREGLFLRDFLIGARTQLVHRESESILVRAGLDATFDAYDAVAGGDDPDETTQQLANLFPTRQDIMVGLYADTILDLGRGVEVTPGARIDLWGSRGNTAFSADFRLASRVPVTKRIRLLNAVGLAHQAPGFVLPIPGIAIGSLQGGLQKSFQTSAGVEVELPLGFTGTATGFFNGFFGMADALGTAARGGDEDIDPNARSLGNSLGLEVFLKRRLTERLGGYVSYTLSRTTRAINRENFVPRFDRTHVLNAAVSWDPGRGWRLGSRFVFYTGLPITRDNPYVPLAPELEGETRLAPFFRIDARIEKRWTIGKRGWISLVLEMLNATLSEEQIALDCRDTCKPQSIGPVSIPSLGVEGGF
ncbi:TonB family protein [Polyangium aurulentum]|uniref:TonB family protein n=1 Tax=Polyangium aurulentum TaxID=2567896 RepID=UPI0010AE6602|nr:TonB family protein [Polyangium aurulentum]UQA59293.1 TonB family protein [Polyangium aurulentum]